MNIFLIRQVDRRATVHAVYETLDEAMKMCLINNKVYHGTETSWWILQTARSLEVGHDVAACKWND